MHAFVAPAVWATFAVVVVILRSTVPGIHNWLVALDRVLQIGYNSGPVE